MGLHKGEGAHHPLAGGEHLKLELAFSVEGFEFLKIRLPGKKLRLTGLPDCDIGGFAQLLDQRKNPLLQFLPFGRNLFGSILRKRRKMRGLHTLTCFLNGEPRAIHPLGRDRPRLRVHQPEARDYAAGGQGELEKPRAHRFASTQRQYWGLS